MALINKSFTFAQCTECKKTMKLNVGKDLQGLKCECQTVIPKPIVVKEIPKPIIEKPKRKKVVEDDT